MKLKDRITSETPDFFKRIRTAGLILAAAGGAILAAPVALPAALITAAGYFVAAGAVASAVSSAVVKGEEK